MEYQPGKRGLVYREQLTFLNKITTFLFTVLRVLEQTLIYLLKTVFDIHVAFWIVDRCLCSPMPSFKTLWV